MVSDTNPVGHSGRHVPRLATSRQKLPLGGPRDDLTDGKARKKNRQTRRTGWKRMEARKESCEERDFFPRRNLRLVRKKYLLAKCDSLTTDQVRQHVHLILTTDYSENLAWDFLSKFIMRSRKRIFSTKKVEALKI